MEFTVSTERKFPSTVLFVSSRDETYTFAKDVGHGEIQIALGKDFERITEAEFVMKCREIVLEARKFNIKYLDIDIEHLPTALSGKIALSNLIEILTLNLVLADYEFNRYKKEPKDGWKNLKEVNILSKMFDSDRSKGVHKKIIDRQKMIAEGINACRELSNRRGNDVNPGVFTQHVLDNVRCLKMNRPEYELDLKVFEAKQIGTGGMGGILAVGGGSDNEPYLLVLEYNGGKSKEKPLVLVGKGVTFDSGGINLKSDGGEDMHLDKTGACVALYTVLLAQKLGLKKNLVAVIPLVENMPSGTSYKRGDVLTMYGGKTVEVANTDAEGRLILADAIAYACDKFEPYAVIDIATLTGAACVALGSYRTAVFSNASGRDIRLELSGLGELVADPMWHIPLDPQFSKEIKSDVADIKNIGEKMGGASSAAAFLKEFVEKDVPWIHLDVAPRMKAHSSDKLVDKGSVAPTMLALINMILIAE